MKRNTWPMAFSIVLTLGAAAHAQDSDELRAKELHAKIKKQMAEIDEALLSAEKAKPKQTEGAAPAPELDVRLKEAQVQQARVLSDIEELIKLAKAKQDKQKGGC